MEEHTDLLHWALSNEARFAPVKLRDGKIDRSVKYLEKLYDLGPQRQIFMERLAGGYEDWVHQLRLSAFPLDHLELHMAAYPDGAHFPFHLDTTVKVKTTTSSRALTGVYYFYREPKGFTGGEIRLYNLGEGSGSERRVSIAPEQNMLLLFPSWVGHDVTQVRVPTRRFADSRFAVNCWFHRGGAGSA